MNGGGGGGLSSGGSEMGNGGGTGTGGAGAATAAGNGTTLLGDFVYRRQHPLLQGVAGPSNVPGMGNFGYNQGYGQSNYTGGGGGVGGVGAGGTDGSLGQIYGGATINHPLFENELGKLIFGVVFSLRNIVRKLTDDDAFMTYSTSKYKLHYFETPSNIRFVMVSDPNMDSQLHVLKYLYSNVYVEYAVKNPLYHVDPVNSSILNNDLLVLGIESYISSLPNFD